MFCEEFCRKPMKALSLASALSDPKTKSGLCFLFVAATLIAGAYFSGSAFLAMGYREKLSRWGVSYSMQNTMSDKCKNQCRPLGSEALPKGIVVTTSDFHLHPLWDSPAKGICENTDEDNLRPSMSLLAIAVGIRQKVVVDEIVKRFPSSDFVVMLFHYDGVVDEWRDLAWSHQAIHISAMNQTKWWFAKRFLHPDIVAEYSYIFLWDQDLGVENFDPKRYISIIKEEGLEISQPALDPAKSNVHQAITVRQKRSRVHRRYYNLKGRRKCDDSSTSPPCIGWVEMMAPVFSRAAWRCVWYMIQNDLIHAWGLDRQLGYCAQGDRMKNVGVIDSEYIVHLGLPTLGANDDTELNSTALASSPQKDWTEALAPSRSPTLNSRALVRTRAFKEMQIFTKRWNNAAKEDACWIDPYRSMNNQTKSSH